MNKILRSCVKIEIGENVHFKASQYVVTFVCVCVCCICCAPSPKISILLAK